jgi:hypothetical protein
MPQIDLWTYYSVYWTVFAYLLVAAGFTINIILPTIYTILKLRNETMVYVFNANNIIIYKYTISRRYLEAIKKFIRKKDL